VPFREGKIVHISPAQDGDSECLENGAAIYERDGKPVQKLIDLSFEQGDSLVADLAFDFEEAVPLPAAAPQPENDFSLE